MTRRTYFGLLAFSLLGLVTTSISAWVHYRLLRDPQYSSFCDINTTVSCAQAYLSEYGSLFGTPVALFGVLWFVAIFGLLIAGRPGNGRLTENVPGYVFALSTVGLAVVLYLAYAAFFVLNAVCILCVLTYVAVIGLFVLSGAQMRFPMTTLPQRLSRDLRAAAASPIALAAIVIFVAGAVSAIAFFPKEAPQGAAGAAAVTPDQRTEVERWFDSQPRTIVPVGETGGAAVVIVKFNDYQCPPCRQTYVNFKPILEKYRASSPGKVLFITKHFPIDPECNAHTPGGSHLLACEAAAGVLLSKGNGGKLEDWIFANQATLKPDALRQAIRDVGGVSNFDTEYSRALEQIKADIAMGQLLAVNATPTFFINGVRISGGLPPQYFDTIIQHELTKAQK